MVVVPFGININILETLRATVPNQNVSKKLSNLMKAIPLCLDSISVFIWDVVIRAIFGLQKKAVMQHLRHRKSVYDYILVYCLRLILVDRYFGNKHQYVRDIERYQT